MLRRYMLIVNAKVELNKLQNQYASSPGISLEPDTPVGSDLHTQETTSFVSR